MGLRSANGQRDVTDDRNDAAEHRLPEVRHRAKARSARFLPGLRKGSREQVAAFDKAQRELNDNSTRERKAKVRDETPRFRELNSRVNEAAAPLSRVQQSRVVRDERMAAADRRERRAQRKARRASRAR